MKNTINTVNKLLLYCKTLIFTWIMKSYTEQFIPLSVSKYYKSCIAMTIKTFHVRWLFNNITVSSLITFNKKQQNQQKIIEKGRTTIQRVGVPKIIASRVIGFMLG